MKQHTNQTPILKKSTQGVPSVYIVSIEALTEKDAVGDGIVPTPDQNIVADLAAYAGINNPEGHPLRTLRTIASRDYHRWELEPESSEDYLEHDL